MTATLSPAPITARIADAVDRWAGSLIELSHAIHADPELGGQEFRAVRRVGDLLRTAGFVPDERQPSSPTAFAVRRGSGELVVAICVEYDALPGIGHACGHNVNAASAVGAAIALGEVADELGLTVKVLGTPAEETTGGKIDLIDEGFFDDVRFAMMAHAAADDVVGGTSLAMGQWDVRYDGSAAHAAAAPQHGVNALDAVTVAQVAIGLARQQFPAGTVVSLIVTEGGSAVNVIPDRAQVSVEMRAPRIELLRSVEDRVRRCLEAGAVATGCALTIVPAGHAFADLRPDDYLGRAYRDALRTRGRTVVVDDRPTASTDMGNVSHLVPTIHPLVGYEVDGAVHHTAEFARHGASASADRAVLDAAFGLAAAAVAAARDPQQRARLLSGTAVRHPAAH